MSEMRPNRGARLGSALLTMALLTAGLWFAEAADVASGHRLDELGIRTRDVADLWSLPTAPLAHADWAHLAANTVPFFLLGLMVLASATGREFVIGVLIIVVVSGLFAWLLSPSLTNTVGASGLIFGWLTYLLIRGFYTSRAGQIALAVLAFMLFGATLWGVLPGTPGVSWQAHLGGAVGGVLAARVLHRRRDRHALGVRRAA